MPPDLTPLEARLLACLIEKQATTPDQYPLTLNALVNACNQKSNREPVMNLTEGEVQRTLDGLLHRHLVIEKGGAGSRVPKYHQRVCGGDYSWLSLNPQQAAVMCELMLRGPQTPGELRARVGRLAEFTDIAQVEATLESLIHRAEKPLVVHLPREPGRREARFAQLLCGPVEVTAATDHEPAGAAHPLDDERIARLEEEVRQLRAEVDELKRRA